MSYGPSYANFEAKEGIVTTETTLTFNLKPRKVVITNDSATKEMTFKFNTSEAFGTLKPTETVSLEVASKTIIINGATVAYRIWGVG